MADYGQPDEWCRRSIRNLAGMGRFSSARTTRQYAKNIWDVPSVPVPASGP